MCPKPDEGENQPPNDKADGERQSGFERAGDQHDIKDEHLCGGVKKSNANKKETTFPPRLGIADY